MMKRCRLCLEIAATLATLLCLGIFGAAPTRLDAKEKVPPVGPDDLTYRLFQFLDTSRGGKLTDFCVLADVYKDPDNPSQEFQRVLRVQYDKGHTFGKFTFYVRVMAKLTPEQLKTYTPKQVYEFGEIDTEKYAKTEPGPFGMPGDMYLKARENRPLASAPITEDVRKTYELLVSQFLLPALQTPTK